MSLNKLATGLLLTAVLATAGHAQTGNGTIVGAALDSQTGRPVNGARIAVRGVTSQPVPADLNQADAEGFVALFNNYDFIR